MTRKEYQAKLYQRVLLLKVKGLSDSEIAEEVTLSVRTIEGHFYRMRKNWGVRNNEALVYQALMQGFIQ